MPRNEEILWRRWDEADRLLNQALDLPPDSRTAFLDTKVAGDPELLDLVRRLLARLGEKDRKMDGPSPALLRDAFSGGGDAADADDLEPGAAVGSYVVVRRLGRGGMATVYEAQRADGSFEQRAAIKVLRRGLDTEDLIARFRTERQILSSLSHAHIARLLDGGALEDGRPYLVMELVAGSPITTHADAGQLSLSERLALFLNVASAVHAAHRQLVVHRDIKPSNILVNQAGRVTLLDFGIAKLLEEDNAATTPGTRILTPDYASPEQIRGEPITTGTDIYQLGLLLRELVTGMPPLAGDTSPGEPPVNPSRMATMAVEGTPPPQARATARNTTPARLASILDGDLDILIGKALRPEPGERYASADEMAADVRRYLSGLPIMAHPESARYRFRKFRRRNPVFLPMAITATVALVGFIAILLLQNRRLEIQRDAAETASRRAIATESFLVDMIRSPDPTAGSTTAPSELTVVDALQRGRARLGTELADQPEVQAALLSAMGRTFSGLGRYATADTLLREAMEAGASLPEWSDGGMLYAMGQVADNHMSAREFQAADSIYQAALYLQSSRRTQGDSLHAALLAGLSGSRLELLDADSARILIDHAIALRRAAGDTIDRAHTSTLNALARVLRVKEQPDSAEIVYAEILRRMEADPGTPASSIALIHNNLGFLLRTRGDLPAAEASYRQAVRLSNEVLGSGHPTSVMYGNNLLVALELQERFAEVADEMRQQVEKLIEYWPDGDWRVGAGHLGLARFYLRRKDPRATLPSFQAGVASYVQALGPAHAWTLVARAQWGLALLESGQVAEGIRELDQARRLIGTLPGGPNAELRNIVGQTVTALREGGYDRQADQYQALLPPS